MSTSTVDLMSDLRERWKPSEEQIAEASEFYQRRPEAKDAVSIHLLVGKYDGFWTEDVEVVPVPGVFTDRLSAWLSLAVLVPAKAKETGLPVTGGYTYHDVVDGEPKWAVFEDSVSAANQEVPIP